MSAVSFIGAVLAGGSSRRMGTDKMTLAVGGLPLWRRQAGVLRGAGAERVMVVRRPGQSAPPGMAVARDVYANAGPLAGLQAALAAADGLWVAVLAVDMPGIAPAWFHWLAAHCRPGSGAIVRHADAFEPLATIYPRSALAEVTARLIRRDLSLQRLAASLAASGRLRVLPVPAGMIERVRSLNTPPS